MTHLLNGSRGRENDRVTGLDRADDKQMNGDVMKLKCPVCGEALEVDVDLVEGQRVSCDVCDSSFMFRKE